MATRTHTGPLPLEVISPVKVSVEQRRTVAMAAAILLDYPRADFGERLQAVNEQLVSLPGPIASQFQLFLAEAFARGQREMESHYVETFDQRRRCSLFLSYYQVGDTRQRGTAILAFRQQLAGLNLEETSEELPDHICVLLEALAQADDEHHAGAVELLAAHRDGLEVLRVALDNLSSPYVHLMVAVIMALPQIDADTVDRYVNLIRSGPPTEMVGIQQLPFPSAQPDDL